MTLEHAPPNRRAFFTSFTLSGTQAGSILATAVFLPISWLPEDQLLSWGWRVPFWLSVVVVAIGYFIRRTLAETPALLEEKQQHEVPKLPLAILFSQYTTDVVRVVLCALVSTVSTIFGVYALSYAVNTVKIDRSTMLWVGILTNFVALAAIPLFATLSDRVGRKPVYVFGALVPATLMFPYLWSIGEARIPLIFIFGILMSGVAYSASNGIWPSFYGEMFSTRVRLSGMAIGTQVGFAIGGFAPVIAAAIQGEGPNGWVPVALLTAAICAIASIAAWTARETYSIPMNDLGTKTAAAALEAQPGPAPQGRLTGGFARQPGLGSEPDLCVDRSVAAIAATALDDLEEEASLKCPRIDVEELGGAFAIVENVLRAQAVDLRGIEIGPRLQIVVVVLWDRQKLHPAGAQLLDGTKNIVGRERDLLHSRTEEIVEEARGERAGSVRH
jgi:MFS family permease